MTRNRSQSGHTLIILVLIIALMAIGMTVAMKVWTTAMQREKEDELIFRGKQYRMAIYLYRKQRGTLPTELKQLEELGPAQTYVLRQPFKDPITGEEFGLVFAGPNNTPIPDEPINPNADGSANNLGGGAGLSGLGGFGSQDPNDQGGSGGLPSGAGVGGSNTGSSFGTPGSTNPGSSPGSSFGSIGGGMQGGGTTAGGLPIMGVHSKSREYTVGPAKWNNLDHYNQWFFLITDLTNPAARVPTVGVPGAPGGPGGQPGRGATPGGARPGIGQKDPEDEE